MAESLFLILRIERQDDDDSENKLYPDIQTDTFTWEIGETMQKSSQTVAAGNLELLIYQTR